MTKTAAPSLVDFKLEDLAQFTREGAMPEHVNRTHWLFYVGRDDAHGVLDYILSRVQISLYLNMFGYDDDELNGLLMASAENPLVTTLITLDKSQSGGVHEKLILASDAAKNPAAFNAHFAIGQSGTHQISHTKGGVLDGRVGFEGSTNWSSGGEGTFVVGQKAAGGAGYKAQNNTLLVFIDTETCSRFTAELVAEHMVAQAQGGALKAEPPETVTGP